MTVPAPLRRAVAISVVPVLALAALRAARRSRRRRAGAELWAEATRAAGVGTEERTGT